MRLELQVPLLLPHFCKRVSEPLDTDADWPMSQVRGPGFFDGVKVHIDNLVQVSSDKLRDAAQAVKIVGPRVLIHKRR